VSNCKIGVFDSGIGGFSVLAELATLIPGAEFYYLSDSPNAPYGEKSDAFINDRCHALSEIFVQMNVDLIVVACNTATAGGINSLRERFGQIFVGVEPYLNSLNHLSLEPKKVVVLTTKSTANSERFKLLKARLDPSDNLKVHVCLKLAGLVEKAYERGGVDNELESAIVEELAPLKDGNWSHAILGCTHYPLISSLIARELGVQCVCPAKAVARRAHQLLLQNGHLPSEIDQRRENFFFRRSDQITWSERSFSSLALT
jgi:glutamate racemase